MTGLDAEPWDGGALRLAGGQVLLGGSALLDVARALQAAQRVARVDGIRAPEPWARLLALVLAAAADSAATSARGSAEVPQFDDPALSERDLIDTTEAAQMLGCTTRNVRGLSQREVLTSGRRVGGRLLLERSEVEAEIRRRAEARNCEENRCA